MAGNAASRSYVIGERDKSLSGKSGKCLENIRFYRP